MTENHVGFLYNAASSLLQCENNKTIAVLRSYYLMRCDEISKTAELPNKYFSPKIRCPHCCIEWKKETEIKVKSRKLSKQQRRRLRLKAIKKKDPNLLKELAYNKDLEQVCTFCKQTTKTPLTKLDKDKVPAKIAITKDHRKETLNNTKNKIIQHNPIYPKHLKKAQEVNVYASSKDIFSLKNTDNTLKSTLKEPSKIIKNSKKKKDKFAGLCQKAVLATAKLKEEQKKHNKLNLFLKPST